MMCAKCNDEQKRERDQHQHSGAWLQPDLQFIGFPQKGPRRACNAEKKIMIAADTDLTVVQCRQGARIVQVEQVLFTQCVMTAVH